MISALLTRNTGKHLRAVVVTAEATPQVQNPRDLLNQLIIAVTQWMINTEDGDSAWQYAGDDFNIGDYASFADDSINPFLRAQGIVGLKILGPDIIDEWNYDTSLVDAMDVEEAKEAKSNG